MLGKICFLMIECPKNVKQVVFCHKGQQPEHLSCTYSIWHLIINYQQMALRTFFLSKLFPSPMDILIQLARNVIYNLFISSSYCHFLWIYETSLIALVGLNKNSKFGFLLFYPRFQGFFLPINVFFSLINVLSLLSHRKFITSLLCANIATQKGFHFYFYFFGTL